MSKTSNLFVVVAIIGMTYIQNYRSGCKCTPPLGL